MVDLLFHTYLIPGECPGKGGADNAGNGADGVGDAHKDGGVVGRYIQVVHTEPVVYM